MIEAKAFGPLRHCFALLRQCRVDTIYTIIFLLLLTMYFVTNYIIFLIVRKRPPASFLHQRANGV